MRVVRWILVLPGAIAASWVTWWLNMLIAFWSGSFFNWITPFVGRLFFMGDSLFSLLLAGVAFNAAGTYISPTHKKYVTQALAGLVILMAGIDIAAWYYTGQLTLFAGLSAAVFVFGAGGYAYAFVEETNHQETVALLERQAAELGEDMGS